MLALSDSRWSSYTHAYGPAEDIPALLSRARDDSEPGNKPGTAWFDLWSALCHQGDTYTASYAAVPAPRSVRIRSSEAPKVRSAVLDGLYRTCPARRPRASHSATTRRRLP